MANSGLRNEELLKEIEELGSQAIKPRNDFGIHFFDEADLKDGIVFAKLTKPKYNNDELRKSIDTEISEFADVEEVIRPDTVLRSVYNEATQSINVLTTELQIRENEIGGLNSRISTLTSERQNLLITNDNLELQKSVSDNQLEVANDRTISSITDLQYSIQKSISEAIQRTSFQARNEALLQQNSILREQLYGRQAQIEGGAVSSGTLFTVRPLLIAQPPPDRPPIYVYQTFKTSGTFKKTTTNFEPNFINGSALEFFNASNEELTIIIRMGGDRTSDWLVIDRSVTIAPLERKTINLRVRSKDWTMNTSNRGYDGFIRFETRTKDGIYEETSLTTLYLKRRVG